MDEQNLSDCRKLAPPDFPGKLALLGSLSSKVHNEIIVDPYYDDLEAFELLFQQCKRLSGDLIRFLKQ